MKKVMIFVLLLCAAIPLWSKDLSGRVGLGGEVMTMYSAGTMLGVVSLTNTALSLRTYLAEKYGLGGSLSMAIDGGTQLGFGAGFFYNLASESNMNLLAKIGFNLGIGEDVTAFSFPVLLNAEFFIDRIPNLGIELGVGIVHLDIVEGDAFFYLGTSHLAPSLGFHYYF